MSQRTLRLRSSNAGDASGGQSRRQITESDLTNKNTSVSVVGAGQEFLVGEDEGVDRWLRLIEGEARTRRAAPAADPDAAMDADDQPPPVGDQDVPMDS